ncbi:MAG: M15 family metallopeptidase [Christensenellales bacterium]
MKKTSLLKIIITLLSCAFFLAGCSTAADTKLPVNNSNTPGLSDPPASVTAAATAAAQPYVTPTPEHTPKPTPKPTLKPTPKPTTAPTKQPSTDSEKVVIAEGFYYRKLDDALKKRITGMSYPADDSGAKISYDDLRYIKLLHYDFEGEMHEGELIVNRKLAKEVTQIFFELYKAKYPLTSVKLVDDYGEPGNDNLSMAANNTSAFNYRFVTGTTKLSRHGYGAAIDINPMLNPYIDGERVAPENGADYVDRTQDFAGKIDHDDLCYKLFVKNGWTWGGDWSGDKDYQHFSKVI